MGCLQPSGAGKGLYSSCLGLPGEIRRKLRLASHSAVTELSTRLLVSPTEASLGIQLKMPAVHGIRGRKSALLRTLISPCRGSRQSGGQNSQFHWSSKHCIGSQKSQTGATPPCCQPCRKRQARRLHRWEGSSNTALSVGAAFPLSSSQTV